MDKMSIFTYISGRFRRYKANKKIKESVKAKIDEAQHPSQKKVREILNHYKPIKNEEL